MVYRLFGDFVHGVQRAFDPVLRARHREGRKVRRRRPRASGGVARKRCVDRDLPCGNFADHFSEPRVRCADGGVFELRLHAIAIGAALMAQEWQGKAVIEPTNIRALLADPVIRQLLVVGLLNAAPAAVSSSLFLFFVEYRLGSAQSAGPLLLLFFLSAAASVPIWARIAHVKGAKWTLMAGMLMAIVTFSFAVTLGEGDVALFAVICLFSGAALGADMTLLPAMFSQRVKMVHRGGGQAFGLWNFCAKFTLALAAVTVLPVLDNAGFSTREANPPMVLLVLTITYAVVPSVLKVLALAVLYWTPIEEVHHV